MEARLERLQRGVAARYRTSRVADIVAVAVGVPDRVEIGARKLPGHLVPVRGRFRPDWRPGAKLTGRNGCAKIFQLRSGRTEIKIVADLRQAGRAKAFDHDGR